LTTTWCPEALGVGSSVDDGGPSEDLIAGLLALGDAAPVDGDGCAPDGDGRPTSEDGGTIVVSTQLAASIAIRAKTRGATRRRQRGL
jgi:hypothetical protein